MEANQSPGEQFLKAHTRFYNSLKDLYLLSIEKARDKTYARDYFKRTLLYENQLVPRYSVFYHSLASTFIHFQKVGVLDSLEQTLNRVDEIHSMTSLVVEQTLIIHMTRHDQLEQLHWLYVEAIEYKNVSVFELIDTEQKILKYGPKKIILLLAITQAILDLIEEFSDTNNEFEPLSNDESLVIQEPPENKITRSQQVLVAYYISQLLGTKHKKNTSKCADALHFFLGISYSQITHSELYKKLLNPLTFSSEKATLQNLQIVRTFFENIGFAPAIDLIDSDIEKVKKTLE